MSSFELITAKDIDIAEEIAFGAYSLLRRSALRVRSLKNSAAGQRLTPKNVGEMGLCYHASDAVTRAAHRLGFVASREKHPWHFITSFGPLGSEPTEEDPIMCLTWGQYDHHQFLKHLDSDPQMVGFFGPRADMTNVVSEGVYRNAYASGSVELRQTACTPPYNTTEGFRWLQTTPADIASGHYPVGEVAYADFPDSMWVGP